MTSPLAYVRRWSTQSAPLFYRTCAVLIVLVALVFAAPHAAAQSAAAIRIQPQGSIARVAVDVASLLDRKGNAKLTSGLPQTLVVQVVARRAGRSAIAATYVRTCSVTYDLWGDSFQLNVLANDRKQSLRVPTREAVVAQCLRFNDVAFKTATLIEQAGEGEYEFEVAAELNPLSKQAIEQIRRWLANASRTNGLDETAPLGSVVGYFVNQRIGEADRRVRASSKKVRLP